jgi:serine/threonine protein kinase
MFPDSIDRYQIQSEIARGGMAIIYLAYDPQHNRDVAIKVLPQEYLHSPQFRARFQREIDIMISIKHPGIVPIYGYGQFQGQLYLVMRYMAGGSLEELIEQQGTISIGETASMIGQIAPILESAHKQGVIHRDLKPSNILFDEEGQPFISDFGIARLTEQSNIAALTGKSLIGSPAYMSPEQGRIGIKLDGRSDIYSLGVVVFEMLTGKLPFDADNPMQLVIKHITEPIPDILAVNPRLPAGCKQVIQTAMAKDPDQRYSNATEFAAALADVANADKYPSAAEEAQEPVQPQIPIRAQPLKGIPKPAKKPNLPGIRVPHLSLPASLKRSSSPARRLNLPRLRLPHYSLRSSWYAFTRPFSRYLRVPSFFRRPAIGYITLPAALRPITRFFHISNAVSLPSSKIWWNFMRIIMVIAIITFCVGLTTGCFLLVRLLATHSTAKIFVPFTCWINIFQTGL